MRKKKYENLWLIWWINCCWWWWWWWWWMDNFLPWFSLIINLFFLHYKFIIINIIYIIYKILKKKLINNRPKLNITSWSIVYMIVIIFFHFYLINMAEKNKVEHIVCVEHHLIITIMFAVWPIRIKSQMSSFAKCW